MGKFIPAGPLGAKNAKSEKPLLWHDNHEVDYSVCNTTWQYSNSSDTLFVTTKYSEYLVAAKTMPAREHTDAFKREEGEALLSVLLDWYKVLNGEDALNHLVQSKSNQA